MSENNTMTVLNSLFEGVNGFLSTKTVVGEPLRVDDAVIIPLMDVSCGMAAGSYAENAKNRGAGGMSAKMSPTALLIMQNGSTRLISVKNQDAVSKFLDMIPDLINKATGKTVSEKAVKAGEQLAEESKPKIERMD